MLRAYRPLKIPFFLFLFLLLGNLACIEEIPIETDIESKLDIENILVVEATLTDELKRQEVRLSRASSFGADSIPNPVNGATVEVTDERGNSYYFIDEGNSVYLSESPFSIEVGLNYRLLIRTPSGEQVESEMVSAKGNSVIDAVYAERIISQSGLEGIAVYVDSRDPSGTYKHFRYNFEETYKIIAPNWRASELRILNDGSNGEVPAVDLIERQQEERVCYGSIFSQELVLSDGDYLTGNSINRNLVHFLSADNPVISHRYSILVKQIALSADAFNFYDQLKRFSESENIFTKVQPGFVSGNLRLISDPDTPVIGYFDVASVTEKRLFFNYLDFFPDRPLPPYFGDTNCDRLFNPFLGDPERDGPIPADVTCGQSLIELLKSDDVVFYSENPDPTECAGPYVVTQRECGDCTALGSNIVPEFWTEN